MVLDPGDGDRGVRLSEFLDHFRMWEQGDDAPLPGAERPRRGELELGIVAGQPLAIGGRSGRRAPLREWARRNRPTCRERARRAALL